MIKRLFDFEKFDLVDLQILSFMCGVFIGMLVVCFVVVHYFIHNVLLVGIMICIFLVLIIYEFKLIKHLAFKDYIEVEEFKSKKDVKDKENVNIGLLEEDKK